MHLTSLQFYFLSSATAPAPQQCGQHPVPASHPHQLLRQLTPAARCCPCSSHKAKGWGVGPVVYPRQARQTDGVMAAGSATLTCVFVSQQSQMLQQASHQAMGGGSSFSLSSLPGEPTQGLSLTSWHVPSASLHILGQPPVTTGKVAGPRMSSLVQRGPIRGRQQVLQLSAYGVSAWARVTNSPARRWVTKQAIGQGFCQN